VTAPSTSSLVYCPCWTRLDAWGRVQIAGQVPQRLVPSWKTTDPLPAAVAAVKTVIPLWAWLVVAAGILLLMILGVACWLCIGLRRKRQQEAAATAAAAAGYAAPGWVVAEPVLPGEQQYRGHGKQASSHPPRFPQVEGTREGRNRRKHSNSVASPHHASTNSWWEGGETATVPSTPLVPPSRGAGRVPRTPPRTGGSEYGHRQRGPAHLPGEAGWGQGAGAGPADSGQQVSGGSRGYGGRGPRGYEGQEAERDWVSGHIPSLPDMPGYDRR
jgi:hypothetical protein